MLLLLLHSIFHSCCFVLILVMRWTVSRVTWPLPSLDVHFYLSERWILLPGLYDQYLHTAVCVWEGKFSELICLKAVRITVGMVVQLSINAVYYLHKKVADESICLLLLVSWCICNNSELWLTISPDWFKINVIRSNDEVVQPLSFMALPIFLTSAWLS